MIFYFLAFLLFTKFSHIQFLPVKMRLHLIGLLLFVVLISATGNAQADWWDDFVGGVHDKITKAADWIRDKAGPTIREKFDGAKQKLQDPETHEKVQEWVQDEALPVVKEKFGQFKDFINEEVMPQVQKMVEAGKAAANKHQNDEEKVKFEDD